jgi:SAM-dependent methyltransferase
MKKYKRIVKHYENCLEKFGDTHLGVDWPKLEDVNTRYKIMIEVINPIPEHECTLLDFGCGASHLYEYIVKNKLKNIIYSGLDLSSKFIDLSKTKFPFLNYYCVDILEETARIPTFDYIIMNGVFTEKSDLTFEEMYSYFKKTIKLAFQKVNIGMAINVMSKHVDWERDDLFHLSMDKLSSFLIQEVSRHFIIRNDYGLYEYTIYIYKNVNHG